MNKLNLKFATTLEIEDRLILGGSLLLLLIGWFLYCYVRAEDEAEERARHRAVLRGFRRRDPGGGGVGAGAGAGGRGRGWGGVWEGRRDRFVVDGWDVPADDYWDDYDDGTGGGGGGGSDYGSDGYDTGRIFLRGGEGDVVDEARQDLSEPRWKGKLRRKGAVATIERVLGSRRKSVSRPLHGVSVGRQRACVTVSPSPSPSSPSSSSGPVFESHFAPSQQRNVFTSYTIPPQHHVTQQRPPLPTAESGDETPSPPSSTRATRGGSCEDTFTSRRPEQHNEPTLSCRGANPQLLMHLLEDAVKPCERCHCRCPCHDSENIKPRFLTPESLAAWKAGKVKVARVKKDMTPSMASDGDGDVDGKDNRKGKAAEKGERGGDERYPKRAWAGQ